MTDNFLQGNALNKEGFVNSDSLQDQEDIPDETPAAGIFINVIEIKRDGWISRMRLGVEDLLTYFVGQEPEASGQGKSSVSCFRDLMNFLKQIKCPTNKQNEKGTGPATRHPAISSRPKLGFFLIDMLHLKILCWKDRCLILDHDQADSSKSFGLGVNVPTSKPSSAASALLVEVFMRNLSQCLRSTDPSVKGCAFHTSWHRDVIRECSRSHFTGPLEQRGPPPFEMLVLDNALHTLIGKFSRHLGLIKPIFNILLEETVANPSDKILRRILAFKKSLCSFQTNVDCMEQSIDSFLDCDLEMSNLYLSYKRQESEHEEVELLLEGYKLDLQEIQLANRTMMAQIEETRVFISTQQNEARNRIIRLSLNLEMCMLGLTFGACFGSIFGMNLKSGLEEHAQAFVVIATCIVCSSVTIVIFLIWRCFSIMNVSAQSYHPILKNLFKYIDYIESLKIFKDKMLNKSSLNDQLMRLLNKEVSQEDVDLIYLIFDDENARENAHHCGKKHFKNVVHRFTTSNVK